MANPFQSMDEAGLRAALAGLENKRTEVSREEQAIKERINQARNALAAKLPDHGGVLGRLPGKTVKTARLIPYDLGQEWPQALQVEFEDGSSLAAHCDYRVEVIDAVTGDHRGARKIG